jgi:hypothetical protein
MCQREHSEAPSACRASEARWAGGEAEITIKIKSGSPNPEGSQKVARVWRSPVPRYPWIQPANSTHPGGGARTHSNHFGRQNLGELIQNAGTSSRCNLPSDAVPEVSPSLDAPATIFHPFGVWQPPGEDLFLNRNPNLNRNLPEDGKPSRNPERGGSDV